MCRVRRHRCRRCKVVVKGINIIETYNLASGGEHCLLANMKSELLRSSGFSHHTLHSQTPSTSTIRPIDHVHTQELVGAYSATSTKNHARESCPKEGSTHWVACTASGIWPFGQFSNESIVCLAERLCTDVGSVHPIESLLLGVAIEYSLLFLDLRPGKFRNAE
jgi:hypothetical protein